jgi:hypothetical protein
MPIVMMVSTVTEPRLVAQASVRRVAILVRAARLVTKRPTLAKLPAQAAAAWAAITATLASAMSIVLAMKAKVTAIRMRSVPLVWCVELN